MDRWVITFSDRARLSGDEQKLVRADHKDKRRHTDLGLKRMQSDENDVQNLQNQINLFNPFARKSKHLVCISTNDITHDDIKQDLLMVQERGSKHLQQFVEKWLLPDGTENFHDAIQKSKSKTFANLTNITIQMLSGGTKTIKADRDLFVDF